MPGVTVVLVDDHNLVRAGLRALLGSCAGVTVIGEATDGAGAMELVRRQPPDIVITDITMKGIGGVELAAALQKEFPAVRVVVLSMHADQHYVQQALASGVSAYLLKDAAMLELELAIQAVLRGEKYLSPAISQQVVNGYVEANARLVESLTARQRQILTLMAKGEAAKEIAHRLGISVKTVEAHRAQLMERLGIRDLPNLVKYAIRVGLADLEK